MQLIKSIKIALQQPLPGLEAQLKMMSTGLQNKDASAFQQAKKDARKAAVMLLLFQKEDAWHTALMQRPDSPYAHSRQISFPGGGNEPEDISLEMTALRETEEEFGIPSAKIQTLGALTPLYIPISNYLVYPYVGYMSEEPSYIPDPEEVAEVLEIPLDDLLNPNLRKQTTIKTAKGFSLKDVPYYELNERIVWGATAMMLSEFVTLVEEM